MATFSYAALSTMILNLPADIYPARSVGSVAGMGGTAAGIGTIIATYLTGIVADRYSFAPILITGSLTSIAMTQAFPVGFASCNDEATRRGVINEI